MRLVIFDMDGTLVDSQHLIWTAMSAAYDELGLPIPDRGEALSHVGRSLDHIFPDLSPELADSDHRALAEAYRRVFFRLRQEGGAAATAPLFPGARDVLDALKAEDETLLAVATGKSMRGLLALIEEHQLEQTFISLQCADHHPSKPHPSMIAACLNDAAVTADRAIMIGDTTFDIDMAKAAGVQSIGVSWGFHAAGRLGADEVVDRFDQLHAAIERRIGAPA